MGKEVIVVDDKDRKPPDKPWRFDDWALI